MNWVNISEVRHRELPKTASIRATFTLYRVLRCRQKSTMHYGKVSMGGVTFRILNFDSHFIRVQIFQIDFPLIISASKYFRQISLSFYICRGQNEQPAISQIYLLGDEMNSCQTFSVRPRLKEGMESESEIINQIFGHHASSKK